MSSTALSHLSSASQTPLFFRLDVRSQRLVALTDVMQTPLYWLDEPRGPWPAQLPDALRLPIEQALTSGQGGKLVLRFAGQQWHVALSHEQDAFWLICLQTLRQEPVADLALHLPRLSQMASQQQFAAMLETLKESLGPIASSSGTIRPTAPRQRAADPGLHPGADEVAAIRSDSRYIRALRTRKSLSFRRRRTNPC